MKKSIVGLAALVCVLTLSSCYTTKVAHGNLSFNDPVVQVQSKKNHILLWGLAPLKSANQDANKYVGKSNKYIVKTQQTFVDGLLNFITFGIYTPSTTTYYLPFDGINKEGN